MPNTKRIQPSTFTLTLGVMLLLFGMFALITTGKELFLVIGMVIAGAGFVGYIFKNDVFDITLGVLACLGVLFFGLHQFQAHFMVQ